jgi:hypothetical protein
VFFLFLQIYWGIKDAFLGYFALMLPENASTGAVQHEQMDGVQGRTGGNEVAK